MASARSLVRLLISPEYRSACAARLRYGPQAFQGATTTRTDRYPVLFRNCALLLKDLPSPRILSFGCATGEEVASLSGYVPSATVVGVDINHWCLRQSKQRISDARCLFVHRQSRELLVMGSFDAIFCMAVFQRTEHRVDTMRPISTGFTFARFEEELVMLDMKLKPGGYFFIDHADFRFEDTCVAAGYRAVGFEGSLRERRRPLFDRKDQLLAEEYVIQRCFQKVL